MSEHWVIFMFANKKLLFYACFIYHIPCQHAHELTILHLLWSYKSKDHSFLFCFPCTVLYWWLAHIVNRWEDSIMCPPIWIKAGAKSFYSFIRSSNDFYIVHRSDNNNYINEIEWMLNLRSGFFHHSTSESKTFVFTIPLVPIQLWASNNEQRLIWRFIFNIRWIHEVTTPTFSFNQ